MSTFRQKKSPLKSMNLIKRSWLMCSLNWYFTASTFYGQYIFYIKLQDLVWSIWIIAGEVGGQ